MRKYYYSVGKDRKGPFTLEELKSSSEVTSETLVWYEGLSTGVPMSELSERHEIVSDPPLSIATKERRSGIELSVVTASIVVGVLMLLVAFNVQSTDENYCVKKGDQCCESKHYERAKEWYQKAIDKNPKNTAANLGMGRAYLGLETDANYYMGRAYLELNEYDQGITCLRHAARLGHKEAQETLQKTGHSW